VANLAGVVEEATKALEGFDYTKALEAAEDFFWRFTDDYLELIKERSYGAQGDEQAESAKAALGLSLSVLQRLFAPFLPFVSEEVWSWWQEGSIHKAKWPNAQDFAPETHGFAPLMPALSKVLSAVRRAKTEAQVSMKAPVTDLEISANATLLAQLKNCDADLVAASHVTGAIAYAVADLPEGEVQTTVKLGQADVA
jgi:valyl-tRNA synthetase